MPVRDFVGEILNAAAGDTASLLEDSKLTRDSSGERQLLLDQQDRDPNLLVQPKNRVADLVNDAGLNALGRLVEDENATMLCN